MKLRLNGKEREVHDGATIADVVGELGLSAQFVVAELNGEPVRRFDFGSTFLKDTDQLEIVRPVAGG